MATASRVAYFDLFGHGHPTGVRPASNTLTCPDDIFGKHKVKQRLARWLAPRGLVFNQDKTRITDLDQGVDFWDLKSAAFGGSC